MLLSLFLSIPYSWADQGCLKQSLTRVKSGQDYQKFWQRDDEVNITIRGKSYPLTYSFDTEISYGDSLYFINQKPEYREKLNDLFRNLQEAENKNASKKGLGQRIKGLFSRKKDTPSEQIDFFNIPMDKILEADMATVGTKTPRSRKQFLAFGGLRKDVPTERDSYAITDLNPRLYDYFMSDIIEPLIESKKRGKNLKFVNISHDGAKEFAEGYRRLMSEIMVDDMKLPVKATLDSGFLEFPHSSYESVPSQWNRVLKTEINDVLKWNSSHMHIGVPAEIGKDNMDAISRAVEARIILEHASSPTTLHKPLYATSYSTLRGPVDSSKKSAGVIRMNYGRHKEPIEMNDLEVRNYLKFSEGQNHLALAASLAKRHEEGLHHFPKFQSVSIQDPNTSNLNGALKYVGSVAQQNGQEEIARRLMDFSRRIENEKEITMELRKDVARYLKEIDIMKLLNPDFFIK